jgi:peroxiredoxin family protein
LSNAQHDAIAGMQDALKKFADYVTTATPEELDLFFKDRGEDIADPVFKDRLARMRENWIEQGRQMEREAAAQEGEAEPIEKATKKADEAEKYPLLQSIRPKNIYAPNDKITNNLNRLSIAAIQNAEKWKKKDLPEKALKQPLTIAGKGTEKPVNVIVTLSWDEKNLHFSKEITPFDREVQTIVCSIYEAGNTSFTAATVYRIMNGMTDSSRIRPEAIKKINLSIDKQRFTRLTIDCTSEAKLFGWKATSYKEDDMLLAVQGAKMRLQNGEEADTYLFNTMPILYKHSARIGQVITYPIELLDTRKHLKNTDEVTVTRGYLLRRIEEMKNKKTKSGNKIRYETIVKESGIKLTEQINQTRKKMKVREQVIAILNYLIELKEIKGYSEYKRGRIFLGIEIRF